MLKDPWRQVHNFALEVDYTPLSHMLDLQNIPWQVIDESDHRELWVSREYDLALKIVEQWQFSRQAKASPGSSSNNINEPPQRNINQNNFLKAWLSETINFPVTMLFIVLGTLGYLAYKFNFDSSLYFQHVRFTSIDKLVESGQWWRFITPIFLHFDIFHLVFNLLLLWYFGKRIEYAKGRFYLFMLIITFAIISNTVQFIHQPNNPFGGLSGVDYGIVGYLLAYQQLLRHPVLNIPSEYAVFLVISLAAGVFGIFEFFGVNIANGAHLGGLVVGLITGAFAGKLDQKSG